MSVISSFISVSRALGPSSLGVSFNDRTLWDINYHSGSPLMTGLYGLLSLRVPFNDRTLWDIIKCLDASELGTWA